MSVAIVWFQKDLRLEDNPALSAACQNHQLIIPVYIANENLNQTIGGAQAWWLHHSLEALQNQLARYNLDLCLKRGPALQHILTLANEYKVEAIYWNRCYLPKEREYENDVKIQLELMGRKVFTFNGSLLHEPSQILTQKNNPFKTFSAFWKQFLERLNVPPEHSVKRWPSCLRPKSDRLEDFRLIDKTSNWSNKFSQFWKPGCQIAKEKLNTFLKKNLDYYEELRDYPAKGVTSKLSPHLHFGEISPSQIWRAVLPISVKKQKQPLANKFLMELGWRDFSYYLLFHYPYLMIENFKEAFNQITWSEDEDSLKRWQQGLTGFPFVDAGMRELWETGYMHNRVRMVVSCFLVKDLLIDWRKGAEWFLDTLLDADIAANSVNWQWISGSGVDAAPYFRIFNPVLQGEKFDPKGEYIKKWLPQLRSIPFKWIHRPWEAPASQLNIVLGKDYPYPIVNHSLARKKALMEFRKKS